MVLRKSFSRICHTAVRLDSCTALSPAVSDSKSKRSRVGLVLGKQSRSGLGRSHVAGFRAHPARLV
jgi:hypothetical protein